jgi:hypothetical protein
MNLTLSGQEACSLASLLIGHPGLPSDLHPVLARLQVLLTSSEETFEPVCPTKIILLFPKTEAILSL